MTALMWLALLTLVGSTVPDAGVLSENEPPLHEVEVRRVDGGFALELDAGHADGGEAQPQLLPPALLTDSPAAYPEELRSERAFGEVKLQLLVDEAGEVAEVLLVESAHPLFARAAVHAAVGLRFAAATLDGVPVPVRLFFLYKFEAPPPPPVEPPKSVVSGIVRSKGNRRPIPGATLRAEDGTLAQTGADGGFRLEVPRRMQWIHITAPGFKGGAYREDLAAADRLEVVYALEPKEVNPYETIVHGERERTEVSRVSLSEQEIREVPGTMGDPFRVVMLLPGVSSMVSGVAYPVVRGAAPAATGYFLDGIRVPLLFHLLLGPAVVHPDFLDGIDFYPGGAPVRYGRLMGGVIDGKVSRPREKRLHATAYADLINAGGFVEYPVQATGTNFSVAGRVSYTPWLLALAANTFLPPPEPGLTNPRLVLDFYDYQARIEQALGVGKLRLFAFGSSDLVGTVSTGPGSTTALQSIAFHRVDGRYRHPLGRGEVEAALTYGDDRISFESGDSDTNRILIDQQSFLSRGGWNAELFEGLRLSLGGEAEQRRAYLSGVTTGSLGGGAPPVSTSFDTPVAIANSLGVHGELVWSTEKWTCVPGIRLDNYHLVPGMDHLAVEPRFTARYRVTEEVTLKGAVGLFHQPPTFLISLPVVDVAGLSLGLQEALQLSAGVEWKVLEGLEVNVDGYVNPLLRTVELTPFNESAEPQAPIGVADPSSHGYATGLEVLVRHPLGDRWFGWLSYTLQYSTRYQRYWVRDESGNPWASTSGYLPFAFDQTHVLNGVLSYRLPSNWTLGVVAHFNTGRPETGQLTSFTQVEKDGNPWDQWVRVSQDKADRLPPFFRIDARVSKTFVFDTFTLDAYLDFLNVTINQEIVSWSYGQNRDGSLSKTPNGLPLVVPILGAKGSY